MEQRMPASELTVWICRTALMLGSGIALFTTPVALSSAAERPAKRDRYLRVDFQHLGFNLPKVPASPKDSDASAIDLEQVRAAQFADRAAKEEAFSDADAYEYDTLLTRFSVAAGTPLSITRRPILAHMLRWVLKDTGYYSSEAKQVGERLRPFVEDRSIQACDLSFLRPSEKRSYPSGHATNGYAAGFLLARVMPERASLLIARGVRYGTNRVVCGAHYPSDVAAGQMLAKAYFAKLVTDSDPQFSADLTCAVAEYNADRDGRLPKRNDPTAISPFSADCAKLDADYYQEAIDVLKLKA
jgi:acid phosphatase (class A)